jgi:hypothetical protein
MSGQIDRKNGSLNRALSRLRRAFTWTSPNQRVASIVGSLLLIISGNLASTVYWDVFSALIPNFPWLGRMVPWAIAAFLGFSTEKVIQKLLDRFRPRGKHWPEQEDPG